MSITVIIIILYYNTGPISGQRVTLVQSGVINGKRSSITVWEQDKARPGITTTKVLVQYFLLKFSHYVFTKSWSWESFWWPHKPLSAHAKIVNPLLIIWHSTMWSWHGLLEFQAGREHGEKSILEMGKLWCFPGNRWTLPEFPLVSNIFNNYFSLFGVR